MAVRTSDPMKGGTRTARPFTAQSVLLLCAALALAFAVVCVATVSAATVDVDDAAEVDDDALYSRSFSYETDADADAAADAAEDTDADTDAAEADAEADSADEEPAQSLMTVSERAHAVADEAVSAPTRVHRRRHTDADDEEAERRAMAGEEDTDDTDDATPHRRRATHHRAAAPKHAAAPVHRKPMPPPAPVAHAPAAAEMRFAKVESTVGVEAPAAVRIKDPDMSFFKQHIAFATWTFGVLVSAFALSGCIIGALIQRFCKTAAKTSSGEYGRAYQPVGDNL